MSSRTGKRVFELLDAIRADHPRRQREFADLMRECDIDAALDLKIQPPRPASSIPTFNRNVQRTVTPMLEARFNYAGSWRCGSEIWLDAQQMGINVRRRNVRAYHRALREHSEESAPMLFRDDRLSLFGLTDGLQSDLTYLVWSNDICEPEVWKYSGMSSERFTDLVEYLEWYLGYGRGK